MMSDTGVACHTAHDAWADGEWEKGRDRGLQLRESARHVGTRVPCVAKEREREGQRESKLGPPRSGGYRRGLLLAVSGGLHTLEGVITDRSG